jgi:hypothetical protein
VSQLSGQQLAVGFRRFAASWHHGFDQFINSSSYRSIIPFILLSLSSVPSTGFDDFISREFLGTIRSTENIGSLFERYVYQQGDSAKGRVDFAVKSIDFYKETNLNTGASSYFTEVMVTRSGEAKAAVDLRLGLDDGTVVDTSWSDSGGAAAAQRTFEFKTDSPPEYAQLDPWNKVPNDSNYSNNSLTVNDFLLPVVKWVNRIFDFFQNILLSTGVLV